MRALPALPLLLVLTACASSPGTAPGEVSSPTSASAQAAPADPGAAMIAKIQADQEQAARQQEAAFNAAMADAKLEADAKKKALQDAEDARRKACDDSRPRRVEHAKEILIARMNAEASLLEHAGAIRKACKLVEKPTGAVNLTRVAGGWRAAPEMADDVRCSGPLPKGISKQNAWVLLARDREGQKVPTGPILDPREDASPEDDQCRKYDVQAGVDFASVNYDDMATVDRARAWH